MKTFREKGRPAKRPYFSELEIERIATEELLAAELLPSAPQAIRIERFIEKRFGQSCVRYEQLDGGILGYTEFGPRGVEAIIVSRALSEEGSRVAERRINTTLAHEAGHGLLHTPLFVLDEVPLSLFGNTSAVTATRVLCRDEPTRAGQRPGYDGRWWEFQANRMMGALLLPRSLVHACLKSFVVGEGLLELEVLPERARPAAARLLSDIFDVNPVVAQFRIATLYPTRDSTQLTM